MYNDKQRRLRRLLTINKLPLVVVLIVNLHLMINNVVTTSFNANYISVSKPTQNQTQNQQNSIKW